MEHVHQQVSTTQISSGNREGNFSIIRWLSPHDAAPPDASYILIKQRYDENTYICFEAAYENGQYWYLLPQNSTAIDIHTVVGWAYFPFDDRESKQSG